MGLVGRKAWSGAGAGNRRFFQSGTVGQAAQVANVCVYLVLRGPSSREYVHM